MATITSVVPYTVDEITGEIRYCQAPGDRLKVRIQRGEMHTLFSAINMLVKWLNLVTQTPEEWTVLMHIGIPACGCLFKYACMYSLTCEGGVLFVPFPGQEATATECEVEVKKSVLVELFDLGKKSGLLEGVKNNDLTPLFSVPMTSKSPDYLMYNLNTGTVGQGSYEAGYIGLLRQPNEVWNSYMICAGEYPDDSILRGVKGILLTGGAASVNDPSCTWMLDFLGKMKRLYQEFPHIKIAGICLGAQVMAKVLGGAVKVSDSKMFIAGISDVEMNDEFLQAFPEGRRMYGLPQARFEEICELPAEGVLYGSSDICRVEVWGIENRVFAVQGHPNCTRDVMEFSYAFRFRQANLIDEAEAEELTRNLHSHENHAEAMMQLMEKFMKS